MTVVWSSLATGAIYALVAIGYNITYLWGGVLNFANSMFIVLGSFIAYWGLVDHNLPVVVVALLAMAVGGGAAVVEERVGIRPLIGRVGHNELVTAVGTATILTGLVLVKWGPDPLRIPFVGPDGTLTLLGGRVGKIELFLILLAIALGIGIHLWSTRTKIGLAGLARTEDPEAASLRGINVGRLSTASFAAAGALGGLLGLFTGPKTFAVASLGTILAVKGFVALTVGGVGSQLGAVVGGLAVGLAEGLSARWIGSDYGNIAVFVLFLAVLLLRPTGIFGRGNLRAV